MLEEEIEINVIGFEAKYASCGSHRIGLKLRIEVDDIEPFIELLQAKVTPTEKD